MIPTVLSQRHNKVHNLLVVACMGVLGIILGNSLNAQAATPNNGHAADTLNSAVHPTSTKSAQCTLDGNTGLLWELKSAAPGLQYFANTFSWYQTNANNNGGDIGTQNGGHCEGSPCDTSGYSATLNLHKICGRSNWRLPTREELRSIVDYAQPYPGPTINTSQFPYTISQFYWSATPSAVESDSAWGIGFAFGYDYAYNKSHAAPVRLVSDAQ